MTEERELFPKYGSIENIAKKSDILDLDPLVVTEKIHGTNVRVMYTEDHGLIVGGRNIILYKDGEVQAEDSYGFTNWLHTARYLHTASYRGSKLNTLPGYLFYGEFHGPGVQRGVKYSEEKDFRVFDIRGPDGDFVSWGRVLTLCEAAGFKTVPAVFTGNVTIEGLE